MNSSAERQKARRSERRAAGLCAYCGKEPRPAEKALCPTCIEKYKTNARKHKAKRSAWHKAHRKRNIETFKQKAHLYYSANKAKAQAYQRKKHAEYHAEFHSTGVRPSALLRIAKTRFRRRLRALSMVCGGGRPACVRCGEMDPRLLAINHKNGNGRVDTKKHGSMPIAIMRGRPIEDLDVRCHNCNILYEYERGTRADVWDSVYRELFGLDPMLVPVKMTDWVKREVS